MATKAAWYVTAWDGPRTALVLGPFWSPVQCSAWAYADTAQRGDAVKHRHLLDVADALTKGRAWFYLWGMAKVTAEVHPMGKLNSFVPEAVAGMAL